MKILINCSNLDGGGGGQVADSICCSLKKYPHHHFFVVLSSFLDDTAIRISNYANVSVIRHNVTNNWLTILSGREPFLDKLVRDNQIGAVLTVFGPSKWIPQCKHLCGFARAQLLMHQSPYYENMPKLQRSKEYAIHMMWGWAFKRCSNVFYTENSLISDLLQDIWKEKKIYTITNYYNQIFDFPELWQEKKLRPFDGLRLLSVTSSGEWKNLKIAHSVAKIFKEQHPDFKIRFVMTILPEEYNVPIDEEIKEYFEFIGPVSISFVPSLYQQCHFSFQPTLLECFTATYPEAMRMERPIITTDLDFSRRLCGSAAQYYSPVDANECAKAIYSLANDKDLQETLVREGRKQLVTFDNYDGRVKKLLQILEQL